MQRPLPRRSAPIPLVICLSLTSLLWTACGGTTPAKTYTIGVVNYVPALEPVLAGILGMKPRDDADGYRRDEKKGGKVPALIGFQVHGRFPWTC